MDRDLGRAGTGGFELTLEKGKDGNTAKGTWAAIQKGGGELASDTWTVAKK